MSMWSGVYDVCRCECVCVFVLYFFCCVGGCWVRVFFLTFFFFFFFFFFFCWHMGVWVNPYVVRLIPCGSGPAPQPDASTLIARRNLAERRLELGTYRSLWEVATAGPFTRGPHSPVCWKSIFFTFISSHNMQVKEEIYGTLFCFINLFFLFGQNWFLLKFSKAHRMDLTCLNVCWKE